MTTLTIIGMFQRTLAIERRAGARRVDGRNWQPWSLRPAATESGSSGIGSQKILFAATEFLPAQRIQIRK